MMSVSRVEHNRDLMKELNTIDILVFSIAMIQPILTWLPLIYCILIVSYFARLVFVPTRLWQVTGKLVFLY